MSRFHFTEMEWEIADEAYADVLARVKREGRLMTMEEVAVRIGELSREARKAAKWKKRAKEAEAALREIGIESLAARRKMDEPASPKSAVAGSGPEQP